MDTAIAAIVASVAAAGISAVATLLVANMNNRIAEIHVMVNSNLEAARSERATAIETLANLNSKHAEIVASAVAEASKASLTAILDQYDLLKKPDK